jgi:hypothetical protein
MVSQVLSIPYLLRPAEFALKLDTWKESEHERELFIMNKLYSGIGAALDALLCGVGDTRGRLGALLSTTLKTSQHRNIPEVMLAAVPSLRAFAISLCGNADRADDLVQETLLRALANLNSFEPGANMSAWMFAILRSLFRSEYRNRRRVVADAPRGAIKPGDLLPAILPQSA